MKIRRRCEATVHELMASLHGKTGRVSVPGFYDHVRPMTERERCHLARARATGFEDARAGGRGRWPR